MRRPKRVRFVDGEMDGVPAHDSPERCEATESPRSDAPKTSEFAYFRKVKNGAVHGHSRSLHKESGNSKRPKTNNLVAETSGAFSTPNKPSRKKFNISVSGERAGPSDHNILLTPRVSKYDEPDQRKQTDKGEKGSSLLFENVTPVGQSSFSSPLHGASENSENEYDEKGIFSAKRHRLRQWAAQTLFSEEAEKVHPKGFDLVTALMSRLFPKDNENNNNSSNEDADTTSKPPILHEPNNLYTGLHLSKRDWDNDIPKITSGRSSEIILSERDTFVSRLPFHSYETESRAQDLLDQQHPRTRLYNTSPTQNDFSLCVPFENYNKPSGSFRFEGLDEFSSITDRPREEQLHRPLLDWDPSEWGKEDILGSSGFYDDDTENVHAGFPTSWSVGQKRLCSTFSNYFPEFGSIPKICSTSRLTQDLQSTPKCIILGEETSDGNLLCDQNIILGSSGFYDDDTENVLTRFPTSWSVGQKRLCSSFSNYLPKFGLLMKNSSTGCLTQDSPSAPKCIVLGEDINDENLLCEQNIIFPHRDQHWPESDYRQKCLSASDFSSEDNYPSIFHAWQYPQNKSSLYSPGKPVTRFSEGAFFNHNLLPSNHHQSSLGTFVNRPLLLYHVSCDRADQELYFGDKDIEWNIDKS
ncbi:hypothetical protein PHJA_001251500 [Phtheirospermum japonicum]|uniref:Uncharacterized protein n=1 Tax=Phtheirospermum japonicum TaxID=374723 RepID=A0A830C6T6_9LAMI|nr:hypothetical protein PHJA_001251500 [Phtheirospermum japonicum]